MILVPLAEKLKTIKKFEDIPEIFTPEQLSTLGENANDKAIAILIGLSIFPPETKVIDISSFENVVVQGIREDIDPNIKVGTVLNFTLSTGLLEQCKADSFSLLQTISQIIPNIEE